MLDGEQLGQLRRSAEATLAAQAAQARSEAAHQRQIEVDAFRAATVGLDAGA